MFVSTLGFGDDSGITASITDNLPDAYSDTSTVTGLPVVWEMGLAIIGAAVLWKVTQRGAGSVRRKIKRAL